jgi:hypothetical protein
MITCNECEDWVKTDDSEDGDCRAVPPKPVAMPVKTLQGVEMRINSYFPRIKGSLGCGSGKPKLNS